MNESVKLKHIAFIMDGNRRWAKERGLPALEGHRQGYDTLKNVCQWCLDLGIEYITFFAFSTENWKRSREEVDYLMDLLLFAFTQDLKTFAEKNIKINILGDKEGLPKKEREAVLVAEEKTKNNTKAVLNIAINYGGRQEIINATKKIVEQKIPLDSISEEVFSQNLYTANQPDPDILVRTSGEFRLSGFLPWQTVYSELFFIKKFWPDFSKNDLEELIEEFNKRNRRFGGN